MAKEKLCMAKARTLFENGIILNEERGFLEELLEALPLVADQDDIGNTIEYYDEYGSTLFCVDIIDDKNYLFRFYENSYPVTEEVMIILQKILGTDRSGNDSVRNKGVMALAN